MKGHKYHDDKQLKSIKINKYIKNDTVHKALNIKILPSKMKYNTMNGLKRNERLGGFSIPCASIRFVWLIYEERANPSTIEVRVGVSRHRELHCYPMNYYYYIILEYNCLFIIQGNTRGR